MHPTHSRQCTSLGCDGSFFCRALHGGGALTKGALQLSSQGLPLSSDRYMATQPPAHVLAPCLPVVRGVPFPSPTPFLHHAPPPLAQYGVFLFFSGMVVLSTIFIWLCLPGGSCPLH